MKKQRGTKRGLAPGRWLLGLLLFAVAGSACTRERRHDMLTLFFDGVPPLDAPEEGTPEVAAARLPSTNAERIDALGYALETTRIVTHQPVADRQCSSCHEVSDRSSRPAGSWVSGTARLRLPVEELCVTCHPQEDPFRHGPAASGQCVICHHPHASQNDHLLRLAEPEKVCSQCHLSVDIAQSPGHSGGALDRSCLECHDPHGGTVAAFLRDGIPSEGGQAQEGQTEGRQSPADPADAPPENAATERGGDGDR